MNKKLKTIICLITIVLIFPAIANAMKAKKTKSKFEAPIEVPAKIKDVRYVTGLPEIDTDKYSNQSQPNGWLDFQKDYATYYKVQINQKTQRGTESIQLCKMPYKSIKELYYGENAILKTANDTLPTALNRIYDRSGWPVFSAKSVQLHKYLRKKGLSPVIIYYKRGNKMISLVVLAPKKKAKAIYDLLAQEAKIEVK